MTTSSQSMNPQAPTWSVGQELIVVCGPVDDGFAVKKTNIEVCGAVYHKALSAVPSDVPPIRDQFLTRKL